LSESLPLLESNDEYKAGALFNLGIASSHLRNFANAGAFFQQCTAFTGPYRAERTDNLKKIQSTCRIVK
jgi:hypothetical protein